MKRLHDVFAKAKGNANEKNLNRVRLSLHFNYKTGWTDDDDATFNLSTEDSITRNDGTVETGSALTGGGDIKLVGSGRFMHGFLAGSTGKLIVTATISPRPN